MFQFCLFPGLFQIPGPLCGPRVGRGRTPLSARVCAPPTPTPKRGDHGGGGALCAQQGTDQGRRPGNGRRMARFHWLCQPVRVAWNGADFGQSVTTKAKAAPGMGSPVFGLRRKCALVHFCLFPGSNLPGSINSILPFSGLLFVFAEKETKALLAFNSALFRVVVDDRNVSRY